MFPPKPTQNCRPWSPSAEGFTKGNDLCSTVKKPVASLLTHFHCKQSQNKAGIYCILSIWMSLLWFFSVHRKQLKKLFPFNILLFINRLFYWPLLFTHTSRTGTCRPISKHCLILIAPETKKSAEFIDKYSVKSSL